MSNPSFELQETLLNENLLEGVKSYEGYEVPEVPEKVTEFCKIIQDLGGRAFLVGGCVRDAIISKEESKKLESKDFDLEIYGLDPEELEKLVKKEFGNVDKVGKQFGVLKANFPGLAEPLDIAVPRTEKKVGGGYKGFEITPDPSMSVHDAARRRDLSLNCIYYDPLDKKVYDPFEGVTSIKNRELDITDPVTFVEDPVRLLRLAQFSARMEYSISTRSKELCTQMIEKGMLDPIVSKPGGKTPEEEGVTKERISIEFEKLFIKSKKPSIGFEFLAEVGYLDKYFTFTDETGKVFKLTDLRDIQQDKEHHEEGNVWTHTMECIDAGAEIIKRMYASENLRVVKVENMEFSKVPLFVRDTQLRKLYKSVIVSADSEGNKEKLRYWSLEKILPEDSVLALQKDFDSVFEQKIAEETQRRQQFNKTKREEHQRMHYVDAPQKLLLSMDLKAIKEKALENTFRDWYYTGLNKLFTVFKQTNGILDESEYLAEHIHQEREEYIAKYLYLGRKTLERDMKMSVMLGILLHDIGKLTTTKVEENGKITSREHSTKGIPYAEDLMKIFDTSTISSKTRALIPLLIKYHMDPWILYKNYKSGNLKAFKKMATALDAVGGNFYLLAAVAEADQRGRQFNSDGSYSYSLINDPKITEPTIKEEYEMAEIICNAIESESSKSQNNILNGNEIIQLLGISPGSIIKKLMAAVDEADTNGVFSLPGDESIEANELSERIKVRASAFVKQLYVDMTR